MNAWIFEKARKGEILKAISGAAVTDKDETMRAAFIAQLGCFDIIDVSGSSSEAVVAAAVMGRNLGLEINQFHRTCVMASVLLQGDLHGYKAQFSSDNCTSCGKCTNVCPNNAISVISGKPVVKESRCRGCGRCNETCVGQCFMLVPMTVAPVSIAVRESVKAGADAIEIHVSGASPAQIIDVLSSVDESLCGRILSLCIGSLQSRADELADIALQISKVRGQQPTLIQADGCTMTGSGHGLSALAAAEVILAQNCPNIYVICSGGCSPLTRQLAQLAGLPIAGVGMGIAFRERIAELIQECDLFTNPIRWQHAREIGRSFRSESSNLPSMHKIQQFRGVALRRVTNQ